MARFEFGAGMADFVVQPSDGLWGVAPGATIAFWDDPDAGTQYTDLLDASGTPITQVVADEQGFIPSFSGPDSVEGMWADGGGSSRAWIQARGTGGGGGGGTAYTSITRVVASATAPADVRAAAEYVCDGVADQVQIQQALDDARDNGGGIIQLTVGTFNLTAPLSIEGTDDVDVEIGISLLGQGSRATQLVAGAGLTQAINLTKVVRVHLWDLGITVSGATHGITSATTNGASSGHRSFWNSSFRNLQVNGPWNGTHTGWALNLGSPFRSVFENIEVGGVGNGIRVYSEHADFNPGDFTFTRAFVELVGDNGIAYQIDSPAGTMNQTNWSMCEAYTNGTGCKGIVVDGSHNRFWGSNLEQFATLVEVEAGESNAFDLNYVTCLDGGVGNKGFVCGTGAWNNRVSANFLNVSAEDSLVAVEDANLSAACPNIFERIRLEVNAGTNITYSKVASTVFRDITAFLDGGTIQAGLLTYPLSTVNDASFTPADHGLVTWTHDPATLRSSSNSITSGTVYLHKVKIVNRSTVVSNVHLGIEAAGSGLTAGQCLVGLYDSSGNRLAVSADQSGNWTSAGPKTIALTAAQTLAVGSYYVAILAVGTTPPQFSMGAGGAMSVSPGLATSAARFLTGPTAQTSLPASIALGSQIPNSRAHWAALS